MVVVVVVVGDGDSEQPDGGTARCRADQVQRVRGAQR